MSLKEVLIDPRTWGAANGTRRDEWLAVIREMLSDPELAFPAMGHTLRATVSEQSTALELLDEEGRAIATCEVPRSAIGDQVTAYVDIVRQIDQAQEGTGSTRLEALDMAKKLAHDDAARTLRRLCGPLLLDHATCRRLWTLLLVLRVDTTRLVGVQGRRPVR